MPTRKRIGVAATVFDCTHSQSKTKADLANFLPLDTRQALQ